MPRKPNKEVLNISDDAIGVVTMREYPRTGGSTVLNVYLDDECLKAIETSRIALDRVHMELKPLTDGGYKLSKHNSGAVFTVSAVTDKEELAGHYELVLEDGAYKLYKLDLSEDK